MIHLKLVLPILISLLLTSAESSCRRGCDLAFGSYYLLPGSNLSFIAEVTNGQIPNILRYNPQIPNQDSIQGGTRINVPFTCDCINREFLGHVFSYNVRSGDTYALIADRYYANLTTAAWIGRFNGFDPSRIPDTGVVLNVTVNCSCGDSRVSKDYGLFVTYPLRPNDSLSLIASQTNVSSDLLQRYNSGVDFDAGTGIVYIPGRDASGNYPPLITRNIRWSHSWNCCSRGTVSCRMLIFRLLQKEESIENFRAPKDNT